MQANCFSTYQLNAQMYLSQISKYSNYRRMIQLQMSRQNALSALTISAKMNTILTNEEAECGAVAVDELGNL